jgi:peptide/nickel transport system substrate-binding protein
MNDFPLSRRQFGQGMFAMSLMGIMAAAGCSSTATTGAASPSSLTGGTLTMGVDADVLLNAAKSPSAGSGQMFTAAVYGTLLRFTSDGTIVPNLAESYTQNADKTLLTLKLRSGVVFSDGTPFDAAAVKGSIDYMKTAGGPDAPRAAGLEVTAKDAATVEIATKEANGLLPMFLCLNVGSIVAPAQLKAANIDTTPIGAGPYTYDAATSTTGNTYTVVKNPKYFDQKQYPFDKVVFKVMADVTARLSALQTGQINAAPLTAQTVKAAEGAGLTIIRTLTNWNGIIIGDRLGQVVPALGNLKVRQAINMVFDRQAMVTSSLQGEGQVSNQIFPPDSDAYRADMKDLYAYDVDKAKALMAEAGFADGFSIEIPLIEGFTTNNAIFISQLKKINITVTEKKLEFAQAFGAVLGARTR